MRLGGEVLPPSSGSGEVDRMRGAFALSRRFKFGCVGVHIILAFSLCTPAAPITGEKQVMPASHLSEIVCSVFSPSGEHLRSATKLPSRVLSLRGGASPKAKQGEKPKKKMKREEDEEVSIKSRKSVSPGTKQGPQGGKKTKPTTPAPKSSVRQPATSGKQKKKEPVVLSDDESESGSEEEDEDLELSGSADDSAGSEGDEDEQSEDSSKGSEAEAEDEDEDEDEDQGSLIKGALVNIGGLDGLGKEGDEPEASSQEEDDVDDDDEEESEMTDRKKGAGKAKKGKERQSSKGGGDEGAGKGGTAGAAGEPELSATVHVGGVPYGASQEEVMALIGKVCGRKTMKGLRWPNKQNRNCGWGFLDFSSKKAAMNAIKLCEASPIVMQGRTLALKPAVPKPPGGGDGGKGGKVRAEKGKGKEEGEGEEEKKGKKAKGEGGGKKAKGGEEGGGRKRAVEKAEGGGRKKRKKGGEA